MTPAAAEKFCADAGLTIVPPGKRPYYVVLQPVAEDPAHCDFTTGELLAEAVLQWQSGRPKRRIELRAVAPGMCPCSGGEPWQPKA